MKSIFEIFADDMRNDDGVEKEGGEKEVTCKLVAD